MLSRRGMLGGLITSVFAPAIVSARNIMPVKLVRWESGVILPEGVKTYESYPWVMTIDHTKIPVHSLCDLMMPNAYEFDRRTGDVRSVQHEGVRVECPYEQEVLTKIHQQDGLTEWNIERGAGAQLAILPFRALR